MRPSDWIVPFWFRFVFTLFPLGFAGVFMRALMSDQAILLVFQRETVIWVSLMLSVFSTLIATAFWLYPQSVLSGLCYWGIRFLREPICVLSLLGVLYLLMIRTPLLSLRGGIPFVGFLLIYGIELVIRPAGINDIPHPSLKKAFDTIRKIVTKVEFSSTLPWRFIAIVLPVGIVCFFIYFVLDAKLSDYGPYSLWNDEVSYWVWLRSFSYFGLNSGYNAPNELLAPLAWSRFGEASPFYIYVYGTIARVIGWFPSLPILINFCILSLSIFLFVRSVKLDVWQVIFVSLSIVLTWPVLLFLPLTTHETLNQAIGIVLAIVFIKLLTERENLPKATKGVFVLFVYFATLVRLSWGLLLIPMLFYCLNGSLQKRCIYSVFLGSGLYISAIVLMGYFLPPINSSILDTFRGVADNGIRLLFEKMYLQMLLLYEYGEVNNPNFGILFQMMLLLVWSAANLFGLLRSRVPLLSIFGDISSFNFYNMVSLLLAGLTYYLVRGFYRTFAPAMLVAYLLLIYGRNYRHLSALLLINIVFFSSYINLKGDLQVVVVDYTYEIPQARQVQAEIERYIVYDPEVENPWCNTILIPLAYYDSRLILIPPGIGISYVLNPLTFQLPVQSRYALLDPALYETLKGQSRLALISSLSIGDLYNNIEVGCSKP